MSEPTPVSEKAPAPVGSGGGKSIIKKIVKVVLMIIVLLALIVGYVLKFETPSHSAPTEAAKPIVASGDEILDSIHRGAEFLRIHQEADGNFSKGLVDPKPAFTALVVDALAHSPDKYRMNTPFIKKAVEAIQRTKQPDGSFCTPRLGLQTYCTAIAVMALASLEDPSLQQDIEAGKNYLLTTQNQDEDSINLGGAGYSAGGKPSGDVSHNWVEAMRAAGVKDGKAMDNAKLFFSRLQNSEENKKLAPGTAAGDDGGSYYRPGESKAGYDTTKDGLKVPKSYGLMSYAALKSFLHLNVDKHDKLVENSMRWIRSNYTLDENKNIGADGLFYYYQTMAKALYIYDDPEIKTIDGQTHHWAEELSKRLISLQEPDGSWHNTVSSQWMENDNVLVSGFVIRTLSICHDQLEREKRNKAAAPAAPEKKEEKAPDGK